MKRKSLIAIALVVVMICALFTGCFSSSSSGSSYSGSSSSSKKGFVGSDGKYHEYNPNYSKEVNDWMAENW